MSRPVEQALNTIIPRRSGALPPELIELATSLLAQSRNKCSNLKAEEEVARTYICANLACERLKQTLNLPEIEPHPPIPPRAYKKLYTYFDSTLTSSLARRKPTASVSVSTPTKLKSTSVSTPKRPIPNTTPTPLRSTPRPLPQRHTPSKASAFSSFRTPKTGLKFASTREKETQVPKWVFPCIRKLCRDMETPRAAPHLMAGVESILCLPSSEVSEMEKGKGKEEAGEQSRMKTNTAALVAALWFFIIIKLRGKSQQGFETAARKKLARESLSSFRNDEEGARKFASKDGEEVWKGWENAETVEEKDVNMWRKEIVGKGWRDMEWFSNIVEGSGVDIPVGDEDGAASEDEGESMDIDANEDEDEHDGGTREAGKAKRGVQRQGKVVLDKYDYLSEAKQRDYEEWRTTLLARVKEMLAEAGVGGADDEGDIEMG